MPTKFTGVTYHWVEEGTGTPTVLHQTPEELIQLLKDFYLDSGWNDTTAEEFIAKRFQK